MKEGDHMPLQLEGKHPVKLEFEDDSFDVTFAEFHKDGTFSCKSSRALLEPQFRLVVLDTKGVLWEVDCTVTRTMPDGVVARWSQGSRRQRPLDSELTAE